MATITISVDDATEKKFRKVAAEAYNGKKGYLGDAVTEAMEIWVAERKQKELAGKGLEAMQRGFSMGKLLYTRRGEIHER